jgi:hypothetical protein
MPVVAKTPQRWLSKRGERSPRLSSSIRPQTSNKIEQPMIEQDDHYPSESTRKSENANSFSVSD